MRITDNLVSTIAQRRRGYTIGRATRNISLVHIWLPAPSDDGRTDSLCGFIKNRVPLDAYSPVGRILCQRCEWQLVDMGLLTGRGVTV